MRWYSCITHRMQSANLIEYIVHNSWHFSVYCHLNFFSSKLFTLFSKAFWVCLCLLLVLFCFVFRFELSCLLLCLFVLFCFELLCCCVCLFCFCFRLFLFYFSLPNLTLQRTNCFVFFSELVITLFVSSLHCLAYISCRLSSENLR